MLENRKGFYESEDRQKYILNQLLLEDAILLWMIWQKSFISSRSSLTKGHARNQGAIDSIFTKNRF